MKAVLALLLGCAAASPSWQKEFDLKDLEEMDTLQVYNQWVDVFRPDSSIEEVASRYLTWLDNAKKIATSNSQDLTYKLRMNQFGDMTPDEFKHYIHGDEGSCLRQEKDKEYVIGYGDNSFIGNDVPAPASVDWTTKGVVTPVKNQGQCGSCWAFSTTGSLECDYAINKGTLNSLSEQQLVDCAGIVNGCMGCNGGQMDGAMNYVQKEGGLCSESEYPYTARDGSCKASSCGTKYNANSGHKDVTADSATSLENAVAEGCVSVAIEADQTAFQYYSSGVLTGNCGTNLDHGVLVVGYGTSGSQEYWKVKNSWGTSWGEKGYVLICKDCGKNGSKGECGILMQPSYPTF